MNQTNSAWDLKVEEWNAQPSRTEGDCITKHNLCCNTTPTSTASGTVQSAKDSNHSDHVPY